MANKSIFGSGFSMNNEFNFKGEKTEIRSKGKACPPVKLSDLTPPVNIAPFVPFVLGAIPVCSGGRELSSLEQSVMGAVSAAGTIQITQDPKAAQCMFNYIVSLLKVVNRATAKNGRLSEDELKKLLMSLMDKWLEESGPGFTSYKQVLKDLMQNATLQDFMKGAQKVLCAMTGDPVNADTGNFIYEKEDLTIRGRVPLNFKRYYNSTDHRTGVMGAGWRHNYEIQLLLEKDRYTILWEDGREEVYLRDGENGPEALFGLPCRLKKGKGNYVYKTQEGIVYTFDSGGKLTSQKDLNGQGIRFFYDPKGRLSRVQSSSGSSLYYEYDSFCDLLGTVTDHTGRRVTLTYELGCLKEVKNPVGQSYLYVYGPDKRISKIRNPRGVDVLENSYDAKGRTTAQKFADGGKIRYAYQDDLNRTLVTEQNGNKVAYVHDERLRNVKTVYVDGEEHSAYNDRNQLVSRTDKNGNRTKFSYDDKGNMSQVIFADGEKRNMTYDAQNRLLALSINGVLKIKNTYDTRGNLIKTANALEHCQEFEYDETGKAVKIKRPDGSEINLQYDDHGNIRQAADAEGNCRAYEYDECSRVTCATDGNGNSTRFAYGPDNQITSITDAAGKCRTYEYTKNGKLARVIDFNGAVTSQEYNAMNQVKALTGPNGGVTRMEYDLMQNVTRRILPNGAEISYIYDVSNRLEQVQLPTGGELHYEYDLNGNCVSATTPDGGRMTMEYDERNRCTKTTDQAGASTVYEYDLEGHLICITNAAGKSHVYAYDKAGNVISETDITDNTTTYEYNELGNITCIIDPKKRKTIYEYAPGGLLLKTVYPDGAFEIYSYDKNGNQILRRNHKGDYLELSYDCMNRLTAVKNNFNQTERYTYNANGAVTSVTDALGNRTYYEYSAGGKLTSVVDAAGNRTEYAYDPMGDLITVCQHQGRDILLGQGKGSPANREGAHYTHYERDLLGKVKTVTNPLGLQEHYSYDLSGRLILKKDREGFTTGYAYNPVGDIERITYADGRSAAFAYNPLRQLTEIRDWLGTTRIELDAAGRAEKVTDHKGRTTSYQWGVMGEREAMTYPNGKKVAYEYDDFSRLTKLIDGQQEIRYLYNEDGRLSEKIFPDGVTSSYKYDSMGLLSGLTHQKDGDILDRYLYEYDQLGNKTAILKKRSGTPSGAQDESGYYQYQYDSMNRLTEVRKDRETLRSYEYDSFGNRIRKTTEEGSTRYYYNAANQLIRLDGRLSEETCQYDPRGNMTAIYRSGKIVNQYAYDETNRLSEAYNANGRAARYEYNGLGSRTGIQEYSLDGQDLGSIPFSEIVCPESPDKEIDYLLDLTKQYRNLLEQTEMSGDNVSIQDYVWDSDAVFMEEGDRAHIYLQDELGSVVRLVEPGGNAQEVYGHDEFGRDLYETQGKIQSFGYTGYRKDLIADIYFAQAREYSSTLGRFVSEDSNKGDIPYPETLNYYTYCWGNPVKFVDLNGRSPVSAQEVLNKTWNTVTDDFKGAWNDLMDFNIDYNKARIAAVELLTGAKTVNISISGRAEMGVSVSGAAGFTYDSAGNIALQFTGNSGGGLPGVGGGLDIMGTNAPLFTDVEGVSGVVGGSFSAGLSGGYDQIMMSNGYLGSSFCVGPGLNLPLTGCIEMHGEAGYTVTAFSFNIFDFYENLKFKDDETCPLQK